MGRLYIPGIQIVSLVTEGLYLAQHINALKKIKKHVINQLLTKKVIAVQREVGEH